MHFALPPRKTSHPPPYARAAAKSSHARRRKQFEFAGYTVLAILTVYLVLRWAYSSANTAFEGQDEDVRPQIVLVTVLDEQSMSAEYIDKIRTNRDDYARRHGYATFYTNVSTYTSTYTPAPKSWSIIPALRHALTLHPTSTHLFSLSPHALIMSPSLSLESHVLEPSRLASLMLKDIPVVPPDSVIHTFSHLTSAKTDFILTQDADNLAPSSMLLRNSDWARYLLDAWFDPLYRAYNFQKAETHALEHIVQWHPTILAKLVLIPQRTINGYNIELEPPKSESGEVMPVDGLYQDGDFVVVLKGCDEDGRDCDAEMENYWHLWQDQRVGLDQTPIPS